MKWNETNYPRIGETVLRTTLPNGLTVAVVPKPCLLYTSPIAARVF